MARSKIIKAILLGEDRASPKFAKVGTAIKALGAAAAAIGAIQIGRKLVQGLESAVAASGRQEAAEVKLAQAIRLTGRSISDVLPRLKEQAAAIQDITGVGDELVLSNQALLVSMGKLRGEGLERATKAALDLAAGNGIELRAAFDLVAKAAVGYTGTLSRYGIIIDQALPQSEKFAAALEKIEANFGGQAQAQLQSYEGRLRELEGRFGDLQESIGGPVREVLTAFFGEVLSPALKDLTDAATKSDTFRTAVLDLGIAFAKLGAVAEAALTPVAAYLTAFALIKFSDLTQQINALASALGGVLDIDDTRFGALAAELERLKESKPGDTIADDLNSAADALDNFNDSIKVLAGPEDLQLGEAVRRLTEDGLPILNAQLVATGQRVESLGTGLKRNLREVGVSAASSLGDVLRGAFTGAKTSAKDLFRSLAADLAAAIAQALILKAILSAIGGGPFAALGPLGPLGFFGIGGQTGGLIKGGTPGRDSVLLVAQQNERLLSVNDNRLWTELLRDIAAATGARQAPQVVSGGGGETYNITIQATDAPSFQRLLEDNPDAVLRGMRRLARTGGRR